MSFIKHYQRFTCKKENCDGNNLLETGILTDDHATPFVSINGGTLTADERLRIQVIAGEELRFSLLDMSEGGAAGAEVVVKENGALTLPGLADSTVSSLKIRVNEYTELWEMIREDYGDRLVHVLDMAMA